MKKLVLFFASSLSVINVNACWPEHPNSIFLRIAGAIVNNQTVEENLRSPITGIKRISPNEYLVESKACEINLKIDVKFEKGPCGGIPIYTPVLNGPAVCKE